MEKEATNKQPEMTDKELAEEARAIIEITNALAEQLQVCIELSALIERAADAKKRTPTQRSCGNFKMANGANFGRYKSSAY